MSIGNTKWNFSKFVPRPDLRRWQTALLGLLLIACSAGVFLPGKSGPLIFDDYSNLVENSYVKINSLDIETLRNAAYSLDAGPMQRPIAMLSYALNYYWAGTLNNTTPYKLTNIVIHALNGLLVFWVVHFVLIRLAEKSTNSVSRLSNREITFLATAAAVLWVVHPIQVGTTLYLIQRMAQLSALFMLLALVCYLGARRALLHKKRRTPWVLFSGSIVSGALGMLSKENTILLPLFIGALELILYSSERPWNLWHRLTPRTKHSIFVVLAVIVMAGTIGAILYALPAFSIRRFTMYERVLTEARVLFFYLSLIFVPRLDRFGHQHDDIELSTSLLDPWTTLPAIIGHLTILLAALSVRKQQPLIALGALWFYSAHLLESTIFALEIAYEHRNYLAVLGPILIIIGLVEIVRTRLGWHRARWFLPVIIVAFSAITVLRSSQWGDYNSFYRYEALHHPESPRIQIGLSILLEAQGRYAEAAELTRRAIQLEPQEVGYLLHLHLTTARQGTLPSPEEQQQTIELLKTAQISATTFLALQHTSNCVQTWCKSLQSPLETWAKTVLSRKDAPRDKSYYYYLLGISSGAQGKIGDAIEYLQLSFQSDSNYLHPLFALASIYVQLEQLENAKRVLAELQRANAYVTHPRSHDLAQVQRDVEALQAASNRKHQGR